MVSKKYELGGSYSVIIFLGPVPDDPSDWLDSPSYAGTTSIFASPMELVAHCANCVSQIDLVTEGYVHLNHVLVGEDKVDSVDDEATVVRYLKENLHWRIQAVSESLLQRALKLMSVRT